MHKKILFLIAVLALLVPSAWSQAVGTINTVAGGVPNNVPVLSVSLAFPTAIARDGNGNIYVAAEGAGNSGGIVYKIDSTSQVTTYAGNGGYGFYAGLTTNNNGDGGPATNAQLGLVDGLAVDGSNNVFISDSSNNVIRKVNGTTGVITTYAGGGVGCTGQTDNVGDGCAATSAILSLPGGITTDAAGNLYIADVSNNRIREVLVSTGVIGTVAGGGGGCTAQTDGVGDNCSPLNAILNGPYAVVVDSHNNIFISDQYNARIREVVASSGLIQTIAGTGVSGFSGDNGPATTALINTPLGISVDANGNVFFADDGNGRVREIMASNQNIVTVAGGGSGCTGQVDTYGDGCPATSGVFLSVYGLLVDPSGNIFSADLIGCTIREVSASTDIIQVFAGNRTPYFSGDGGPAVGAQFYFPYSVAGDTAGNFYIADSGNTRIRKVTRSTGVIQTVAGGGTGCTQQTDTLGDGCPATQAILGFVTSVYIDPFGNIYISDYGNSRIRKVAASTGLMETVAGGGTGCTAQTDAAGDGCPATQGILLSAWGVYADTAGNVFVADYGDSRIREVFASTGLIQTIAGTGVQGYNGDNIPANTAEVTIPTGIYGDSNGNIFLSDAGNYRIREIIASSGQIVTVAGTGVPGYNGDNIPATTAQITFPYGLFLDTANNIFITDSANSRVREIVAATGSIQTVAGTGGFGFSGDGGPATSAQLGFPIGLGGDPFGNLYISDDYNNRIREVFGTIPATYLTITTLSPPPGTVGVPYSFQFMTTGGTKPVTGFVISGSVPPGLTLNGTTGLLSGTPTTAGTFTFSGQAMDSSVPVETATATVTITIAPATGSTAVAFTGLTASQSITAGAASITLSGVIGTGTAFPAAGELVRVSINGLTQNTAIGTNGAFSITFTTSAIPASATPYPITYFFQGDATFTAATDSSTALTVNAVVPTFVLTVTDIGTGNGMVTDNLQLINCLNTAGVQSGTCSASYAAGTPVTLTATATSPSSFAAWGGACSGNTSCVVTMTSVQAVTASFTPPPQQINLAFSPGTGVTGMAAYDCPSNPSPSPANPCLDPNAHALALTVPQVLQPFTLTVQATELPPSIANGICPNGGTPSTDPDCRFVSFFTYQTLANGDKVVPLCYPFANGNCVHYQVFSGSPGVEPNPSFYIGPIDWYIGWNNDTFTPPAPYTGSTPRLYDDPDYAVSATSPYGTDCTTPMLVGNPPVATNPPIYCQFEFDITTSYNPTKKVDAGITGRTKQFNDVEVAIPPANVGNLTMTEAPLAAAVIAGGPIGYTITVTNSAGGAVVGATLTDVLPSGTNVNWTISPAYAGPGTCAIAGAVGSQALSCAFGTISASQTFTIGLLSSSSTIGVYTDTTTLVNGAQQSLAFGTLTVQGLAAVFSGLTPSQSITASAVSVNLSGTIGSGTTFAPAGEPVTITINGIAVSTKTGTNGAFTATFATANIPASTTPYPITYSYAGDGILTPATDGSTTLTVNATVQTATLIVTDIGTGSGTVTDSLGRINCATTAGVQSGTCSASYAVGTQVTLTATATSPNTFAAWGGACSGTSPCALTLTSATAVTASFTPPPQQITVTLNTGTASTAMATYNCPSNPSPSPANPCTDPNAHAVAFTIGQVLQPFTLTVQATELPPSIANGICPNGGTPSTDPDCRFVSFFTYQTLANGDKVVPLCYPFANGNCVHYQVFSGSPGVEPNPSFYIGPIDWYIGWNNDTFTPPAPYTGSTPRLYDDPDYAVSATSPYGTDCTTPMLVGNPPVATNPPIYCQFEFDITTSYNPTKKVDAGITGRTKQFNDVEVAIPPANVGNLTVTETAVATPVTPGSPIGFTISVTNNAGGPVTGATLTDALPAGTNVNWSISPAFTGPGTCAISGAVGSQVLSCAFGTIGTSQSFTIGLQSPNSSIGTYTDTATITFGTQQILSIGTLSVQGTSAFASLTPSQTITAGTASISLSGTIASGTVYPAAGKIVSISINGATQTATIGINGAFSATFATASIPSSATPYVVTYSYAGDLTLTPATNASTTLMVLPANVSSLVISPISIDFGQVPVGGLSVASITLTNSGTTPIQISHVSLSRTGTGNFHDYFVVNRCTQSLAAGKSCVVVVSYAPDDEIPFPATASTTLVITDSAAGNPQSVPLTAQNINPKPKLSSSLLTFGGQKVGTTSKTKSVTLTNVGTTPLSINAISISGDFVLDASSTCQAGASLTRSQSCSLVVAFKPTKTGERTGLLRITDNAVLKAPFVVLSGTGQ